MGGGDGIGKVHEPRLEPEMQITLYDKTHCYIITMCLNCLIINMQKMVLMQCQTTLPDESAVDSCPRERECVCVSRSVFDKRRFR